MKKSLYGLALSLIVMIPAVNIIQAQSKDPAVNKRIVESKNYIFKAETVSPARGTMRQLTPEYDLVVAGDTVIAYLPYFGRAYSAPITSDGGIKFTSVKSAYRVKQKKGRWEITMEPTDVTDVRQLYLDIFENGRASLRVVSLNRQPISFNGYVVEGKERPMKAF